MNQTELIYQELLKIVDERGIFLDYIKLTEKISGFWLYSNNRTEAIAINEAISGSKRNFTLAHELGHSALHKNLNYNILANGGKSEEKREKEADEYARRLIKDIKNRLQREVA